MLGVVPVVSSAPTSSHLTAATPLLVPVDLGVDRLPGSHLQQYSENNGLEDSDIKTLQPGEGPNWLEGFQIKTSKQDKNNYLQDSLETC